MHFLRRCLECPLREYDCFGMGPRNLDPCSEGLGETSQCRGAKLPRENFCRSTAVQLPSPLGPFRKEDPKPSHVGERQPGRHLSGNLDEVTSQKLPRDIGESNFEGLFLVFGCLFCGIEGGLSLLFGIEISLLVSRFCFCCSASLGSTHACLFLALTSCKLEVSEHLDTEKKIEKSPYLKRHLDTN